MKRLAQPRTWPIEKKEKKYIAIPLGKKHTESISLVCALRDMLHLVKTRKEARNLIRENCVFIDNKAAKDEKIAVGLFDIVALPKIKKFYRLVLSNGKLQFEEIAETNKKICKIIGKKILKGGKIQLNLYDGKNFISDKKEIAVGDSVIVDIVQNKITGHLPLKKGATLLVISGKYASQQGKLLELEKNKAILQCENKKLEVPKKNLFVIG